MKQEELYKVLRLHIMWLNKEEGGVRADLRDASLCSADLQGADLRFADLRRADLRWANLGSADLRGDNLIDATLIGADLTEAKLDYRIQPGLVQQVAQAALASDQALDMSRWHTCDTTHCIAGWACNLNPVAQELEKELGTELAALLTLGPEVHSHFYDQNEEAKEWLKGVLHNPKTA